MGGRQPTSSTGGTGQPQASLVGLNDVEQTEPQQKLAAVHHGQRRAGKRLDQPHLHTEKTKGKVGDEHQKNGDRSAPVKPPPSNSPEISPTETLRLIDQRADMTQQAAATSELSCSTTAGKTRRPPAIRKAGGPPPTREPQFDKTEQAAQRQGEAPPGTRPCSATMTNVRRRRRSMPGLYRSGKPSRARQDMWTVAIHRRIFCAVRSPHLATGAASPPAWARLTWAQSAIRPARYASSPASQRAPALTSTRDARTGKSLTMPEAR